MDRIHTKFVTATQLPLVIEPAHKDMQFPEFLNLLRNKNGFFKQNLLKYGGLLFRNFPIHSEHEFAALIENLQTGDFIDYVGGDSPRNKVIDGVYTSTEAPPSFKIPLHNELSYVRTYPKHIYFYCDIPPVANGETIISDARKIYQAIDPEVKRRFVEKGLRYVSCYPSKTDFIHSVLKSHKSWVHVFETEDKKKVERKCRENDISFVWKKNDWLEISQVRPALSTHPETQENVWFNQAHIFDLNPKLLKWWRYLGTKILYWRKHTLLHKVLFADGTEISRRDLYHILDILDENTISFSWQKGDVLVLDNILSMHGRATFSGNRRILTAMTG